ncbi:MAG: DUF3179 domain-containing protein [Pseudomonadota bacterium]
MIRILLSFIFLMYGATSSLAEISSWKFEGWTTDFSQMSVDPTEILSGGPPRDGIPPIEHPKFVDVSDEMDLTDLDPVIGLEINGDARAYPLRILTWHEIVNDNVGGTPVAVTYCPLCNAAIVFDARIDGKVHTFGTTGKLRNSDLIMYDRTTESWWQQFTGTAIAGSYTGNKLKLVPARLEAWSDFKARNPSGKVLVPNNPSFRSYGRNPYIDYDISVRPFLFRGELPSYIPAMARVVVVRRENKPPVIVSMETVRKKSPHKTGGLVLKWKAGQASALHKAQISEGRDVGTITAFEANEDGEELIPYDVTFAFVAHAFYPDVKIEQ